MNDLLIRGATVYDGAGAPGRARRELRGAGLAERPGNDEHVAAVTATSDNRTDGALPIPLVTATHRRRVAARPRKARAGPARA